MSILKSKIAKALKKTDSDPPEEMPDIDIKIEEPSIINLEASLVSRTLRPRKQMTNIAPIIPKTMRTSMNIMKNYARAMASFAVSEMALPYLPEILKSENVSLMVFQEIIGERKGKVNCIKSLRELLLVRKQDDQQLASVKRCFQKICATFLKFFCVNWIFHSKINDKKTHLKYRFKILRRVLNPEAFTYLEGFTSG